MSPPCTRCPPTAAGGRAGTRPLAGAQAQRGPAARGGLCSLTGALCTRPAAPAARGGPSSRPGKASAASSVRPAAPAARSGQAGTSAPSASPHRSACPARRQRRRPCTRCPPTAAGGRAAA
eukprot:scaffold21953_cov43-Phaeocystis_antarctica.AAC.1